jgi:hypothetical protein
MSTSIAMSADKLKKHQRRKVVNVVALTLSLSAMAFGLFWLAWILFETIRLGVGGLAVTVFTQMTPPPNVRGRFAQRHHWFLDDGEFGDAVGNADWHHGRHLFG